MSLKSRLSQLQTQAGKSSLPTTPAQAKISELRERLSHIKPERVQGLPPRSQPRMSVQELVERLNGELISDGLIKIRETISSSAAFEQLPSEHFQEQPVLPGETDPMPGLYIDTETTGLAGGSGTLAFLVGVASIENKHIHLTQYLMTSFSAEKALLTELSQLLKQNHRLVSYNGKSYDVPLLLTRFRMQGLKTKINTFDHLDLLHSVRRLFKQQWDDCRLITVERQLLKLFREDDLPGSEAPVAWFNYIRNGHSDNLIKVVEHNRQDIITLPAIHFTLPKVIEKPTDFNADIYGVAKWLYDNNSAFVLDFLIANRRVLCKNSKRLLALLYKRDKKWESAISLWYELSERGCIESIINLAKYHEHISKDINLAWNYCQNLPDKPMHNQRRKRLMNFLSSSSKD